MFADGMSQARSKSVDEWECGLDELWPNFLVELIMLGKLLNKIGNETCGTFQASAIGMGLGDESV